MWFYRVDRMNMNANVPNLWMKRPARSFVKHSFPLRMSCPHVMSAGPLVALHQATSREEVMLAAILESKLTWQASGAGIWVSNTAHLSPPCHSDPEAFNVSTVSIVTP
jgi:hypothetical protein